MKPLAKLIIVYILVTPSMVFSQETFLPQIIQDIIIDSFTGILDPSIVELVSGLEGDMIIENYREYFPLDDEFKFILVDSSKTMPLFGNTQQVWRYELFLYGIPLIGPHFTLMEFNGEPHKINYNWPQRNFLPKPEDIKINQDYEFGIIESIASEFLQEFNTKVENPIMQSFKEKIIYLKNKEQFVHCLDLYFKDGKLAYCVSIDLVDEIVLFVSDLVNY